MRRLLILALPVLSLVGLGMFVAIVIPPLLAGHHYPTTPKQPLYFDHQVHVQQAGADCEFCHRTANQSVSAGLPDVEQCMFCHQVVATGQPSADLATLRTAWAEQRPIVWARVHVIPDHSKFPHDAHVQAGVTCATCHGDVGRMGQVQQVRSLKMGDCVECHKETSASTECGACHY